MTSRSSVAEAALLSLAVGRRARSTDSLLRSVATRIPGTTSGLLRSVMSDLRDIGVVRIVRDGTGDAWSLARGWMKVGVPIVERTAGIIRSRLRTRSAGQADRWAHAGEEGR